MHPKRPTNTDALPLDEDMIALLASEVAPATPDPLRTDALLSRVLSEAGLEPPLVQTVRVEDGEWRRLGAGVDMKIIAYDANTRFATFLARYAPGGEVGEHYHLLSEECMLVSGDLTIAGIQMQPGDFQTIRPGARHGKLHSEHGALVFVRAYLSKPLEEYR